VRFARSTDGGETFLPSIRLSVSPWFCLGPHLALDGHDNPHITWTEDVVAAFGGQLLDHQWVRYTRSTDGGNSFLPSIFVCPDTARMFMYAMALAVDDRDNPIITWEDAELHFTRSYDGGRTFTPYVYIDPHPGYESCSQIAIDSDQNIYITYTGDWWASYRFIFLVKSSDRGLTFGERVWVDRDSAVNGISSIALPDVGLPRANGNDVMVAWDEDTKDSKGTAIRFAKSTDGGGTFGDVVTVAEGKRPHYCPSLATDPQGNPVVVYAREGEGGFDLICCSASTDGGSTFLPTTVVDSVFGTNQCWPQIAIGASGIPMVVWRDQRFPVPPYWRVYFSKGNKTGTQENHSLEGQFLIFKLGQNCPNPFIVATTISYTLPTASSVKLDVCDSSGRLVRTLVDEKKPAGRYRALWDGRNESGQAAASGIYFCSMRTAGFKTARKMVLLR
jgi:hypothetical protein